MARQLDLDGIGITSEPALADAVLRGLAQGWLPGLAWLDGAGLGRTFVGAEPDLVIEGDDVAQLDGVDARWRADPSRVWVGWLTYELGVDHLLGRRAGRGPRPGLCLRRYPAMLERNADGRSILHGDPDAEQALLSTLQRGASGSPFGIPPWPLEPLRPRVAPEEHRARVERACQQIAQGRAMQLDLTQQLGSRWKGSAPPGTPVRVASAYASLRRHAPVAMGALLEADADTWFLSNSSESLLEVRRGQVQPEGGGEGGADLARSRPAEGTRSRHADPVRDAAAALALQSGGPELSRHRAVVEQVRHDLARIALPGTVHADPAPTLRTLPTAHQLITDVRATLPPGLPLRTIVQAVFPGGRVSGVPRRDAVELVDKLEEHARGIYGGAIVVLEPTGLSMSIPVRTASVDRYGITLCVGSNVVADSDPETERLATLAEAAPFSDPDAPSDADP